MSKPPPLPRQVGPVGPVPLKGKGMHPGWIVAICLIPVVLFGGCLLSILLPSLGRARETANRVKCASNLRHIGQVIELYKNDHGGKFPGDLSSVLATQDVAAGVFCCPSSDVTVPDGTLPQKWADVSGSYVYYGAGWSGSAPPEVVVARERDVKHHRSQGMNVLFGDGRVEFHAAKDLPRVMEASRVALEEWRATRGR